jgi:ParB family chromosome partitioning protein
MADWWEVSGEGYLRHVSKGQILAVVEEARSGGAAALGKLKKDELVVRAESVLSRTRWLPSPFTKAY